MNKNGAYIYNNKILDPLKHAKAAQVGVDLSVHKIEEVKEDSVVYFDDNSKVYGIEYTEAPYTEKNGKKVYNLEPNKNYSVTFEQGLVTLNSDEWALIVQRSSLLRAGCHIISSIWDPGYGISVEEKMNTTLLTGNTKVNIPVGTRVAQILVFENEPVESDNLYNGRWQGTNKA